MPVVTKDALVAGPPKGPPTSGASWHVWPCLCRHLHQFQYCHPLCLQIRSTPFLSFPACGQKALKQNQSTHLDPVSNLFRSQVNKEFLSHSLSIPHFISFCLLPHQAGEARHKKLNLCFRRPKPCPISALIYHPPGKNRFNSK